MIAQLYEAFSATVATGNPYIIVGVAFIVGLVTSFTPCLYPMIPITMGILQAQAVPSMWSNFLTALSYVLGMAAVYAGLGYVAATSSIVFGRWASNPWFILIVVLLFLYLAFSMFGFYEVRMPAFLTKHHEVGKQGSLGKSFLFGMISGTVMSPCLTPPLAIILALVAKSGSPVLGVVALFVFALGMGVLLLVIGTFSSSLSLLPRAGMWMVEVKRIFGFVMLVMCAYIARPVIGDDVAMYLYGLVAVVAVGYYLVVIFGRGKTPPVNL